MDRVITIQYQLPAEPLALNEDTMLSPVEEEALSKCSEAEHLVSVKAYTCFREIMAKVGRAHCCCASIEKCILSFPF